MIPAKIPVVLVVEDEPIILMAAVDIIENLGFIAWEAQDADDAILILEQHPEITIVFTDIDMAGSMDGLALALYSATRWPPLKFIIVSGGRKPALVEMPPGAEFLCKPYGERAIARIIESFA